MYLTLLKTAIVDALQKVYNSNFVASDFHGTKVSIEYPLEKQHYPGIWINYDDQDSLTIAGIDHKEYIHDDENDPSSPMHEVTRWMFAGEVTLTFVALSSLERDNLYDQFVRVFAFSRMERAVVDFRTLLTESNPFLAINANWDELRPHGDAAGPGTPWGSQDEVIYEKSLGFDIEGEFVSDPGKNTLVPLAQIIVEATDEYFPDGDPYVLGIPAQG